MQTLSSLLFPFKLEFTSQIIIQTVSRPTPNCHKAVLGLHLCSILKNRIIEDLL